MATLHPMLIRQLKKAAVLNTIELQTYVEWLKPLETIPEHVPLHIPMPVAWHSMVCLTNQAYLQFNRDLELRSRSLQLVSDEMVQTHELQRAELERQQLLIDAMKSASYQLSGKDNEIHTPEDAVRVLDSASRQMTFYTQQLEVLQKALDVHTVLIQCTASFTITTGNDNFKAMSGWGRNTEQVSFFDIVSITPVQISKIRECISEGHVWQGELQTKENDTPSYWWQLSIVPAFNNEGALDRIIIASVDISKQKITQLQVQQQKEFVETLLASIPLPVYVKDLNENYIQTNDAFENMFGLRPIGNPLLDTELSMSHPLRIFEEHIQTPTYKDENLRELECRDNKNKPLFLKVNTQSFVDAHHSPQGIIGVISDVTTFKAAEQSMRDAVETAQSANRMKGEFLANMSHEIRTPLNGVIGLNELAMDMATDEVQRDYLKTAHTSAMALLGVLNDILDFSKIEAGKIDLEHNAIEPEQLIWDLVNEHSISANQKNLALYVDIGEHTPSLIYTDGLRLRQILSNLLSNAIKFTSTGYILCTCNEANTYNTKTLRITVQDTGQGIEASKIESIFDPFIQEDNTITRRYGGTGLGLTISRKLIHAMGGSLDVHSERNKGSLFTVILPLRSNEVEYYSKLTQHSTSYKNILLIEDQAIAKRIIQHQLYALGIQTMAFGSQEDVLSIMGENIRRFDLLMLNIQYMDTLLWTSICQKIQLPILTYGPKVIANNAHAFVRSPFSTTTLSRSLDISWPNNVTMAKECLNDKTPKVLPISPTTSGMILVVEDYPINQMLITAWLQKWKLPFQLANNGKEALVCLDKQPYSLILMDCQMPIMDGFEATRKIRSSIESFNSIPIIAMTANALTGDKQRCLDAGMTDYISKPWTPLNYVA